MTNDPRYPTGHRPTPATAASSEVVIRMWGESGVGKSTLLAASLGDIKRRQEELWRIDFTRSQVKRWEDQFRALRRGVILEPTQESAENHDSLKTALTTTQGRKVLITDIKGGIWQTLDEEQRRRFFAPHQAFLFVLPWDIKHLAKSIDSILLGMEQIGKSQAEFGLVFTKCERLDRKYWDLLQKSPAPESDAAWATCTDPVARELWQNYPALLEKFRKKGVLWFTSVWGWQKQAHFGLPDLPAVTLSEYGTPIPCRMNSEGVSAPFHFLMNRLLGI